MKKTRLGRLRARDFDAWAYNVLWPQSRTLLPLSGSVSLTVEDVKFAYNAWSFLRLAMFYGCSHPKVLSNMTSTTPSMDIQFGGNRLFYMHARVGESLSINTTKIALTPCHPKASSIHAFSWTEVISECQEDPHSGGLEIVLGMENGLSPAVSDSCDHCVFIPQYGSIGSLSMLSALAIAVQVAATGFSAYKQTVQLVRPSQPVSSFGHMPLSSNSLPNIPNRPPHEADLLSYSTDDIKEILRDRRSVYPLQISVMMYNELGDRNIGAVMRNANAFNCERMIIVNRRRFNRRGAVGTQNILDTRFFSNTTAAGFDQSIEGYAVWLLYPYYPYLQIYSRAHPHGVNNDGSTFLRHDNPALRSWCSTQHVLNGAHPLTEMCPQLQNTEVYLDDPYSIYSALVDLKKKGYKGVLLAVSEEGASPPLEIATMCSRVVYVTHPSRLPQEVQRGLNPALSTAVAFERLRTMADMV